MQTLTCTRGIPGSGKSTWAKEQDAVRVNRDDLRFAMYGKYSGLSQEQENMVTKVEEASVQAALDAGHNVVVDAMHLKPSYLRKWDQMAVLHGAEFKVKEFPADLELSLKRDAERDRHVGESAIRAIYKQQTRKGALLPYTPFEPISILPKDPWCFSWMQTVIVDLDGTLAINDGHRGPYEWDKVFADQPNGPVISMLKAMKRSEDVCVHVFSGRMKTTECFSQTYRWLEYNLGEEVMKAGPGVALCMREEGDYRPDFVVKHEMYERYIRGRWNVRAVFDDRDSVVKMWRKIGLPVFQVNKGDF